jgi:predicted site-specific integrase-resolvase
MKMGWLGLCNISQKIGKTKQRNLEGKMKSERVGIYARVSTLDNGQDVELQLADLRSFVEAREGLL